MLITPYFGGCKYTNNFLFINKNIVFQHFVLLITSSTVSQGEQITYPQKRCYRFWMLLDTALSKSKNLGHFGERCALFQVKQGAYLHNFLYIWELEIPNHRGRRRSRERRREHEKSYKHGDILWKPTENGSLSVLTEKLLPFPLITDNWQQYLLSSPKCIMALIPRALKKGNALKKEKPVTETASTKTSPRKLYPSMRFGDCVMKPDGKT